MSVLTTAQAVEGLDADALAAARVLLAQRQPWRSQAACLTADPEAFWPAKGEPVAAAKRVCAGCPVRLACLEHALAADEREGVWGGLSARERARLRTRPARAVPPVGVLVNDDVEVA